ncbi:FMN-binding protein [Couchioplanes caeruleus]|uniref:FMN-binding protein n=1 Tax=Couchioplanes caeruleus TaxID=56438 RepID=UPI00201C21D9|nr:FMN-binding protein [Couchioplanes caeruleus]UQU61706.1 FMN-binding protein [Couchioplanes caeruleus]
MRRITLWLFSTVAALVLLFSYRTSTDGTAAATAVAEAPLTAATEPPAASSPSPSPSAPSSSPAPSPSSSSRASSPSSAAARTYTGSVAQTRWGPVQVGITVSGGRITDVAVPVYPNGNHRDQEINAYALPVLRQETLAAQGAAIDAVSGATVTSDGYVESLQAALDAAHL